MKKESKNEDLKKFDRVLDKARKQDKIKHDIFSKDKIKHDIFSKLQKSNLSISELNNLTAPNMPRTSFARFLKTMKRNYLVFISKPIQHKKGKPRIVSLNKRKYKSHMIELGRSIIQENKRRISSSISAGIMKAVKRNNINLNELNSLYSKYEKQRMDFEFELFLSALIQEGCINVKLELTKKGKKKLEEINSRFNSS